jgi:sortase A
MFRERASLLKVGVVMAALALVLVVCAVVVNVVLRTEPGRAATEVARNALGEAPWNFFGAEGIAAEKSSNEDETRRLSSSGESGSPSQGSSGSGGSVGEAGGGSGEAQRTGASEPSNSRSGVSQPAGQRTGSEAQGDRAGSGDQVLAAGQRTASGTSSESGSGSLQNQDNSGGQLLPAGESDDWPRPTQQEIQEANSPRHYHLVPGAVMGLTIDAIGIHDAPVFDSDGYNALVQGIAHVPGTSWPWSPTPQRNVYLAGHRMGYRGTWSRMLFYNLDELEKGDKIVLKDRSGRSYEYRVSEIFQAEPTDAWVMGQVRGRDMVSLQTCTPLYTFEHRLIVRADRI